jgi:hypothetical protein
MTAGYQYGYNLEAPAIVSTGEAVIFAPFGLGYEIQLRMSKAFEHYYDDYSGVMFVSCADKSWYQDISIWIDDYEFEILVDDYFLNLNEMLAQEPNTDGGDDVCVLGIVDDWESEYWVLGDVFLRGYYSTFDNNDHANARMGFVPHATSDKKFVEKSRLPVESIENILWELSWISLLIPPNSDFSVISWIIGTIWVWLFGIYEWGWFTIEVNVY